MSHSAQLPLFHDAALYSELATGMYGSTMVYGLMHEIGDFDDIKRLLHGSDDREGYKRAFLSHCHLEEKDLLFVNWGSEEEEKDDDDESEGKEEGKSEGEIMGTAIPTSTQVSIAPPPFFLVCHEATKSIVLCIRGTWNLKDYLADLNCSTTRWESGCAHEGIALIANSLFTNEALNQTIVNALQAHPDFRVVAVGHSLGAGIAALLTILWRTRHLFNDAVCFAIAPPPILSPEVAEKGVGFVYSFVNEDDLVPRLSKKALEEAIQLVRDSNPVRYRSRRTAIAIAAGSKGKSPRSICKRLPKSSPL